MVVAAGWRVSSSRGSPITLPPVRLPAEARPPDMIPEWMLSALRQRSSAKERQQLDEWRAESPRNERRWRMMERMWRATAQADRAVATKPPSAAQVIAMAGRGTPAPAVPLPWRARWRAAAIPVAAAAVMLVAAIVDPGQAPPPLEHITAPGEMTTVRLADGSIVRLGESSRLRIGRPDRHVWLEGQAFFAITRHPDRPFVVATPAGRVRVLGTRFSLRADEDTLSVAVVEGRVAVEGEMGTRELGAGEVSVLVRGSPPERVAKGDVSQDVQWLGTTIILEETPLRIAVEEIRRVHGISIRIADPALAERTVSAVFTTADGHAVVQTLCRAASVRCDATEDGVTMHDQGVSP